MCYPARDTWGNYTTHWRPFPGDTIGLTPTPADGGAVEIQDKLPTFIVPRPDQEDLRGPVRPTRPAAPTSAPAEANGEVNELPAAGPPMDQPAPANEGEPAEPAADQAPGALDNLDLPGFGPPQGSLQPLPRIEDGPPALPSALSQAITMGNGATFQANFPTQPAGDSSSRARPMPTLTRRKRCPRRP